MQPIKRRGCGTANQGPPPPPPLPRVLPTRPGTVRVTKYFSKSTSIYEARDAICSSAWSSGDVFLRYLESHEGHKWRDLLSSARILELGAGVGHVGIAIVGALKPISYTFTDLFIRATAVNLALNAEHIDNSLSSVKCFSLDWFDSPATKNHAWLRDRQYNCVVAIDCVWVPDLYKPFVQWIVTLANSSATIYLAHEHRSKESYCLVFKELIDCGLVIRKIPTENLPPKACPLIALFTICREPHLRA